MTPVTCKCDSCRQERKRQHGITLFVLIATAIAIMLIVGG